MKKLAILLLTILTMATAAVCGCEDSKKNNDYDQPNTGSVQTEEIQEDEQGKPECPDREKRDEKCPDSRRPHRRRDKKIPHPISAYTR